MCNGNLTRHRWYCMDKDRKWIEQARLLKIAGDTKRNGEKYISKIVSYFVTSVLNRLKNPVSFSKYPDLNKIKQ